MHNAFLALKTSSLIRGLSLLPFWLLFIFSAQSFAQIEKTAPEKQPPSNIAITGNSAASQVPKPENPVLIKPSAEKKATKKEIVKREAANKEPQRWTLNQQNTDIKEFISQIATITGDTFILDPKLRGGSSINVISSRPMTKSEIYDIFLEVLSANDFAVIPKGANLKSIVAHVVAKSAGNDLSSGEKPKNATMVTQVIDLHSVSAIEVIPIIRPLIAQYGHAAASATGNAVVISDLKDNVERITRLVRDLDDASNNDYEVFKLQHAWVSDVARVIQETLSSNRSTLSTSIQVIADERSNRLVIKGSANKRARVRKLVQTLDQEGVRRSSTRVIFLRHADAKNLAGILTEASQNLPGSLKNKKGASTTKTSQQSGNQSSTAASTASSESKLTDGIFIKADETTNALVMIAEPNTLKELEDLVRQLDIRRAQVLIEAAVVEISGDTSESLGLQWGIDGIKTGLGTQVSNSSVTRSDTNSSVTGALFGNNNISIGTLALRNANFGLLINALTTKTNANLLSTPSLLTLDNEEAELSVGQEVPFKTGSYSNDSGGSNPFTTTERKPVGLTLKVTPHIGDGNTMRLEIEQEISKLIPNSTITLGTSDVVTDRRKLRATIIVDNTQTVVMGGLLQDDIKKVESKIPFLGDIPFLGHLFRNKADTREKKNLMLFIKPTIMRDSDSLMGVTRDKYNTLRIIRPLKSTLPETAPDLFKPVSFPK